MILNAENLDSKLIIPSHSCTASTTFIDAVSMPFTSSEYYFITLPLRTSIQARRVASEKVISLINDLEKTYPPSSNTDTSGIEKIYE